MTPSWPTTQPDCGVINAADIKSALVPLAWNLHVLPPSSVCRIVPFLPTAQPEVAVGNAMPIKDRTVGLFCRFQVLPPSWVWTIAPSDPAAQPNWLLMKVTKERKPGAPLFSWFPGASGVLSMQNRASVSDDPANIRLDKGYLAEVVGG